MFFGREQIVIARPVGFSRRDCEWLGWDSKGPSLETARFLLGQSRAIFADGGEIVCDSGCIAFVMKKVEG